MSWSVCLSCSSQWRDLRMKPLLLVTTWTYDTQKRNINHWVMICQYSWNNMKHELTLFAWWFSLRRYYMDLGEGPCSSSPLPSVSLFHIFRGCLFLKFFFTSPISWKSFPHIRVNVCLITDLISLYFYWLNDLTLSLAVTSLSSLSRSFLILSAFQLATPLSVYASLSTLSNRAARRPCQMTAAAVFMCN